jgi:predicted RNase H-like HicB family nuclease
MKYNVALYTDENGVYVAESLDFKGCIIDGLTREEALKNIKEAILAYKESLDKEYKEKNIEVVSLKL